MFVADLHIFSCKKVANPTLHATFIDFGLVASTPLGLCWTPTPPYKNTNTKPLKTV